mmetsp:Transcript_57911/g.167879  ORF Transcript_57911/g.167879 Transcript_57911/m.167879 type:complete len:148 (+) Transcript_57911:830-1273(+)
MLSSAPIRRDVERRAATVAREQQPNICRASKHITQSRKPLAGWGSGDPAATGPCRSEKLAAVLARLADVKSGDEGAAAGALITSGEVWKPPVPVVGELFAEAGPIRRASRPAAQPHDIVAGPAAGADEEGAIAGESGPARVPQGKHG